MLIDMQRDLYFNTRNYMQMFYNDDNKRSGVVSFHIFSGILKRLFPKLREHQVNKLLERYKPARGDKYDYILYSQDL
jgi:hypothetical protein